MSSLVRGLAAGAVGTTVLNAVTYLDMALTGRSASTMPSDTALAVADRVGLDLPSDGSRDEAYGALAGLATGTAIGGVAALVRSVGIRLPLLAEAAVIGVGAMVATDAPAVALDLTELGGWSPADWVREVGPHLAYGAAVAASLRALEPPPVVEPTLRRRARPASVLAKSLAIGVAAGARSSLGLVPPALALGSRASATSLALVGTELVLDKLPFTPSRIGAGPTGSRVVTGAVGAATVARHQGGSVAPALVVGALGALVGTVAGAAWREVCADRGWTWQGAVAEDAAALALTAYAWRS